MPSTAPRPEPTGRSVTSTRREPTGSPHGSAADLAHVAPDLADVASDRAVVASDGDLVASDRSLVPSDRALVAPALVGGGLALLRAPVAAATWRAVAQATVGVVWMLLVGVLALVLAPLGVGLGPLFGVGLLLLVVTLAGARGFAVLERGRLFAQLGVRIVPPSRRTRPRLRSWRGLVAAATDAQGWRAVAYAAVALLLVVVEVAVAWSLGAAVALLFSPVLTWDGAPTFWQVTLVAAGLAGPWLWAVGTQALALAHVRLARALLGPSTTAVEVARAEAAASEARDAATRAEERADHLATTRTRAVGAADDDRRRIERDLHDGAQQRLVALGVELGTARRAAASDPDAAAAALDHAHREIKETLSELRDLVRGIHPAVLTDRGLDAALSAVAARHPVPVTVEVDDPAALTAASPGAQAAAYFVTTEALTNSARHSGATRVVVRAGVVRAGTGAGRAGTGRAGVVRAQGAEAAELRHPDGTLPHPATDVLRLEVVDDGRGGATASPGGGLDGLRSRVEALDGTFRLDSPADRGTRILVEVPCAS